MIPFVTDVSSGLLNFGFQTAGNAISYDQQKSLMRKQQAWAEKMWNMQNEYNTPVNQKARLDAAGINGAMALANNGSVGQAGSPPSASSPSAPSFNAGFDGTSMTQHLLQQQMIDSRREAYNNEVERGKLENNRLRLENMFTLENLLTDLGIKKAQHRQYILGNMFAEDTYENRVQQVQQQTYQSILQTGTMYFEREMARTNYQYLPQEKQAALKESYARTASNYAAAALANAQAHHEGYKEQLTQQMIIKTGAEALKTQFETFGIHISNVKAAHMMKYEIERAKNNTGPDNLYQILANGDLEDYAAALGTTAIGILPWGKGVKALKTGYKAFKRWRFANKAGKVDGNTIFWD